MTKEGFHGPLEQIDECCWRIPKSYKPGMRVEGRIFADDRLIEQIRADQAPEQVANVAFLPGIQMASLAMPDIHWGYGFCIGGVCATDPDEGGVISPGGVGYDINCGVRLVRTNLDHEDVQPRIEQAHRRPVPPHPGRRGRRAGRTSSAARNCSGCWARAPATCVARGWATAGDIEHTEAGGCLPDAEPELRQPAGPRARRATSAARSARATTSSKSRWSTRSSTTRPPRSWACNRAASA